MKELRNKEKEINRLRQKNDSKDQKISELEEKFRREQEKRRKAENELNRFLNQKHECFCFLCR